MNPSRSLLLNRLLSLAVVSANVARDCFAVGRKLALPISLAVLALYVLAWVGQTQEVFRALIENWAAPLAEAESGVVAAVHFAIAVASTFLMSASIAFSAWIFIRLADFSIIRERPISAAVPYLPLAIGILPMLGAYLGISWSANSLNYDTARNGIDAVNAIGDKVFAAQLTTLIDWAHRIDPFYNYSRGVQAVATLAFAVTATGMLMAFPVGPLHERHDDTRLVRLVSAGATCVAITVTWASVTHPVPIGRVLGTISLFGLFVSCVVLIATGLSVWSRKLDFPLLPTLVSVALLLALLDLNDNHVLRRLDKSGRELSAALAGANVKSDLPTAADALETWYNSRSDRDAPEFSRHGYPVYVVAAQGGGIYAAAETLFFLTRMQTLCERFAQHLFAISGVSGGSVGAAIYSAFAAQLGPTTEQCRTPDEVASAGPRSEAMQRLQQAAFEIVRNDYDFLAPLVAAALFPDFAQRFLWPPIPAFSRARALEKALEDSWMKTADNHYAGKHRDALGKGVAAAWTAEGARPATIFNTTEANSGRRRIISPFSFDTAIGNDIQLLPLSRDRDIPLSTGAVASARFPWITPAAWFLSDSPTPSADRENARKRTQKVRIVDGGYFENSGVATAIDLMDTLQRAAQDRKLPVQINLIVLTSGTFTNDAGNALSELLSPLSALFYSRSARTYSTIELASRKLGQLPTSPDYPDPVRSGIARLQRVAFPEFFMPLPLGWRLSKVAASEIFFLTGRPSLCAPDDHFEQTLSGGAFGSADCVKLLLLHQLRGDDLGEALQSARNQTVEKLKAIRR